MILTCPSCGTRYQTERARIAPPGCNVRCAKCQTVWFQTALESDVEIDPEISELTSGANSEPAESDTATETRKKKRRGGIRWALVLGWLVFLGFVGSFVWAAIEYRQEIARVWPQSATLYAYLNLPVNTRGLAFVELTHQKLTEANGDVLQISGRVLNVSDRELPVPEVYISLRDFEERELYGWTFSAGATTLAPGQSQPFVTRLPNPPAESRRADIRFVGDPAQ